MRRKPELRRLIRRRAMRAPHRWLAHLVTHVVSFVCIGLVVIAPGVANAAGTPSLQPGVHIDPGSPAAQEYAIPLQQARGAAPSTTGGASSGGSDGSNRPFGSGITPAKTSGTSDGGRSVSRGGASRSGSIPIAKRVVARPIVPALVAGAGGSGSGIDWMVGAGLLTLVIGGLGGIVLARVGRRPGASLS
jgi:hypothetical protein